MILRLLGLGSLAPLVPQVDPGPASSPRDWGTVTGRWRTGPNLQDVPPLHPSPAYAFRGDPDTSRAPGGTGSELEGP